MLVAETEASTATVQFRHAADDGKPVVGYEIRIRQGEAMSTEENFVEGIPVAHVAPGEPGTMASFVIKELKPLTSYVVGVRVKGRCGTQSTLSQAMLSTKDLQFKQLTGCFIATAASTP